MTRTCIWTGAASAVLLVMLVGAAPAWMPPEMVITPQDNGRTIRLRVGKKFQVEVTLAGDEQVVVPEFDAHILTSGMVSMKSASGPQGSIVTLTYNMTVRQEGETDLIIPVKGSGKRSKPKPLLKVRIVAVSK